MSWRDTKKDILLTEELVKMVVQVGILCKRVSDARIFRLAI